MVKPIRASPAHRTSRLNGLRPRIRMKQETTDTLSVLIGMVLYIAAMEYAFYVGAYRPDSDSGKTLDLFSRLLFFGAMPVSGYLAGVGLAAAALVVFLLIQAARTIGRAFKNRALRSRS